MQKMQITTVLAAAGVPACPQAGTRPLGTGRFLEWMRGGASILTPMLMGSFVRHFTRQYPDYELKKQMIPRDSPLQMLRQVASSDRKDWPTPGATFNDNHGLQYLALVFAVLFFHRRAIRLNPLA